MPFTLKDIERLKQEGKIRGVSVAGPNRSEPKKSKYGNKKVVLDGIEFDSLKESGRYVTLRIRLWAGEIEDLQVHVPFKLEVNGELICTYEADFVYKENGELRVEDVKSKITRRLPVYRLKKKLMKQIHGIEIKEV
jgi:hypothetical protein